MKNVYSRILLFLLSLALILFASQKLCGIRMAYQKGKDSYGTLVQQYAVTLPPPAESPLAEEFTAPEETAPISISFDALLEQCPDVVGWLYCEESVIHYPVVQGRDNEYYLHRLLDGSTDISGTIFMDYRNSRDFSDLNTILYGHNMKNGTMFGSLQKYKDQEYFEEHPVWYLLTPERDYKILLVGGYTTTAFDPDTYRFPDTTEERDVLIAKAKFHTTFEPELDIKETDRLITLSTCAYEFTGARYVVVGVLKELLKPPS